MTTKEISEQEMGSRVARRFMNSAELAEYLGQSKKFVEKYTASGRIPGVLKCGRSIRFDKDAVDRRLLCGELLLPESRT